MPTRSTRMGLLVLLLAMQVFTVVVSYNKYAPLQWHAGSWTRGWPFRWYVRFGPHKYRSPASIPRFEMDELRGDSAGVRLLPSGPIVGLVYNGVANLAVALGCIRFCRTWNGRLSLAGIMLFVTYFGIANALIVAGRMPWEHVAIIGPLTAATIGYFNRRPAADKPVTPTPRA